jgi:hypothetical protein
MNRAERNTVVSIAAIATFAATLALEHHNDHRYANHFTQPPEPTYIAPAPINPLQQLGPFNNGSPKGPYQQEGFYGVYEGDKITKLKIFMPKPGKHEAFTGSHRSNYEDLVLIYSPVLSKVLKKSINMVEPDTERAILLTGTNAGSPDERISSTRVEFDKHTKRITYIGDAEYMDNKNAHILPSKRVVRALGYTITGNVIHRHRLLGVDLRVSGRKAAVQKPSRPHAPSSPKAPLPSAPAPIPAYPSPGEGIYI